MRRRRVQARRLSHAGRAVIRLSTSASARTSRPTTRTSGLGFVDGSRPKGSSAGFYFGISRDSCGVGAGLWAPDPPRLEALRAHFAAHYARYFRVAEQQDFASVFKGGQSPRYKRVPKPYEADHPAAQLLTLKGVHVSTELDARLITSSELVTTIGAHFAKLAPLVALLDEALC